MNNKYQKCDGLMSSDEILEGIEYVAGGSFLRELEADDAEQSGIEYAIEYGLLDGDSDYPCHYMWQHADESEREAVLEFVSEFHPDAPEVLYWGGTTYKRQPPKWV